MIMSAARFLLFFSACRRPPQQLQATSVLLTHASRRVQKTQPRPIDEHLVQHSKADQNPSYLCKTHTRLMMLHAAYTREKGVQCQLTTATATGATARRVEVRASDQQRCRLCHPPTFSLSSAMFTLPCASVLTVTIFMPAITAEAGLVPCALTGMMHTSRWPSPLRDRGSSSSSSGSGSTPVIHSRIL